MDGLELEAGIVQINQLYQRVPSRVIGNPYFIRSRFRNLPPDLSRGREGMVDWTSAAQYVARCLQSSNESENEKQNPH